MKASRCYAKKSGATSLIDQLDQSTSRYYRKLVTKMKTTPTILFVLIFLAGCAGPPADNPLLLEARTVYRSAAADRSVLINAQAELEDAQNELETAEQLWRAKGDKTQVDHHAYMAKQRSRIAIETSKLKGADYEVARADLERKQVQLEARSVEANQATAQAERERALANEAIQKAENAQGDAERARKEAADALADMQEMTSRLAELEARQTERGIVLTLGDVLFDVAKTTLKAGGSRATAQLGQFMLEYPERKVLVEGYTDSSGREETNQRLSEQRAEAVKDALVSRGIAPNRIQTTGYGESYPVADNNSSAGRSQNRRVEVVISDENGLIKTRN